MSDNRKDPNHAILCKKQDGGECDCIRTINTGIFLQIADELNELKLSRQQWEETAALYAQNSADKDATIAQLRTELDVACHVKANDKVDFDFAVLEEITICRGVILTLRTDLEEARKVITKFAYKKSVKDINVRDLWEPDAFLAKHGGDAKETK